MAPEYALWGFLTDKADVYSFGIVALEIVAGKKNTKYHSDDNYICLLDWVWLKIFTAYLRLLVGCIDNKLKQAVLSIYPSQTSKSFLRHVT